MQRFFVELLTLIVLGAALYITIIELHHTKQELSNAQSNVKALIYNNNILDSTSSTLKLTVAQLTYLNDSISVRLTNTLEQEKINKKKISQLQYLLSTNYRIDTLCFTDTIFVKDVAIDTCLAER